MKKCKIPEIALFGLLVLLVPGCNLTDAGLAAVEEIEQEKTNWCWAACMQSILDYNGTTVSQCEEANWLFSSNNCCNLNACNSGATPGEQQDVLDHWGLSSDLDYSTLTWNELKNEIDAGQPVSIGFSWCTTGGHSLIIAGFCETGGTSPSQLVLYMDPWFGEGYNLATYDWVVGGCPGDHEWYRTIYNIH